jgi:hypothetical protein
MDPLQSSQVTLALLGLRVDSLEKDHKVSVQDAKALDTRVSAGELKSVAMDAALQSVVESRKMVAAAVITNIIGLGLALLFIIPVMLDRTNSSSTKPPITIIK